MGRDSQDKRDTRAVIQAVADAYLDNWGDPTIKVPHGTPCAGLQGRMYTGTRMQFEDRQTVLGHKAAHVTTHYSAADIENLISFAEKVCELFSRKSPALSIVRSAGAAQVTDKIGGKGGNRTLDPGIMSAVL